MNNKAAPTVADTFCSGFPRWRGRRFFGRCYCVANSM